MKFVCVLILLFCLCGLRGAEGKSESGIDKPPAKRGRNKSALGSGELVTKDSHRCTWETAGETEVTLFISCNHGEKQYWCRYVGKPDLCPGYSAKSSQYWRQVVGKLVKRRNACAGEKILKTRSCKKSPLESHMKLSEMSGEEGKTEHKETGRKGKKRGEQPPAKVRGGKKEEKALKEAREDREVNDGNAEAEMEPVENYCAEGWLTVCSFFVKFFDG